MLLDTSHGKPSLLMLSDCFPDPGGDRRAARAWQLLCCAATTHQVYLSAEPGRAINLDQWRRAADLAERIHIESRKPKLFALSKAHGGPGAWARQRRFDALLATSPRAWPGVCPVVTGMSLCDFADESDRPGQAQPQRAGLFARLIRPTLKPRRGRSRGEERWSKIIAACDQPLVASTGQANNLPTGLPPAVTICGSDAIEVWAGLFQADRRLNEFVTPRVKVMAIQPGSSRKAA